MPHQEDEIIASTFFIYKGSKTEIFLYIPQKKWIDGEEFVCKFSIEGEYIKYRNENIGYDSMQSIILSLSSIGYYLQESKEIEQEYIDWPGGKMQFPELNRDDIF